MNDFDPSGIDPSSEARRDLHDAVDNERNITLALMNKQLTIDRLHAAGMMSDDVIRVAERFEWPDEEDEIMDPIVDMSPDAFLDRLIEINAKGGLHHLDFAYFYRTLEQAPLDPSIILNPPSHISPDSLLGTLPAVHRAYAVAPDLFSSTREVLRSYRAVLPSHGNTDDAYMELIKPKNYDVVLAISMCYRIIGNLLTVDDGKIWRQLRGSAVEEVEAATPFLSADKALLDGSYF